MKWHIYTKIIIRNASHFVIKLAKKKSTDDYEDFSKFTFGNICLCNVV